MNQLHLPSVGTGRIRLLGMMLLCLGALPAGLAGCALGRSQPAADQPATGQPASAAEKKTAPVAVEKRVALVIGNANYASSPLQNPINDARSIADSLRGLGFEVRLLQDATLKQMSDAAREFGDLLPRDGVGLFYYAGHAMQIKGRNYLIPVGADIRREDEVTYSSFDAGQMLEKMESARSRVNIVILDACRNNPFARSFRSSSQGLAQMDAPVGSYIAFATAPAKVASDGNGKNGLYTQHLLEAIRTPGLKIEEVFKQVRIKVMADSSGQQIPWDSSSLAGDFYFSLPEGMAQTVPAASPASSAAAGKSPSPGRDVGGQAGEPRVRIVAGSKGEGKTDTKAADGKPVEGKGSQVAKPAATAQKNDPAAAEAVAGQYKTGLAAKAAGDIGAAAAAFGRAAEAGHAGASYQMGLLLKTGRKPVTQDLPRARRMFQQAAEQGDVQAQLELAQGFAHGPGANCGEANKWALKAAQGGSSDAAVLLGELYRVDCQGARRNPAEAARWLQQAADKGIAKAQFSLGVMYVNGDGVQKDLAQARKWLNAAAAKGIPSAKFYLDRLGN